MSKTKVLFNWSGGKDSAFALYMMLNDPDIEICCLFTTVNEHFQRISMHGVQKDLLERQAQSIGLPLEILYLPEAPTMDSYEAAMRLKLQELIHHYGFKSVAFGDIFLEDLRAYREQKLNELQLNAIFPLWGRNTKDLIQEFICNGFKTITCCVDALKLDKAFCGRTIDNQFIAELPVLIDPCGEHGEFHTFVFDGPIFKVPIDLRLGETIQRGYNQNDDTHYDCQPASEVYAKFWYTDLIPVLR